MGNNTYRVLDSGNFRKLEQVGPWRISRPALNAVWKPTLPESQWNACDAVFHRKNDGSGSWDFRKKLPESWVVDYAGFNIKVKPTGFGHLGFFAEQYRNWNFFREEVKKGDNALNLFGYSGIGSMAFAANGANVSIEGYEQDFALIFLEQDVFKIELPEEMGGDVFFIKHRVCDIDYTGVWKNSDSSITAVMSDSTNALIVTLGSGEDAIDIQGSYEEEDNAFIMLFSDDNYDLEQEIGSGMVSASGRAYTFCMDANGDWSSTILMKTSE